MSGAEIANYITLNIVPLVTVLVSIVVMLATGISSIKKTRNETTVVIKEQGNEITELKKLLNETNKKLSSVMEQTRIVQEQYEESLNEIRRIKRNGK